MGGVKGTGDFLVLFPFSPPSVYQVDSDGLI